MATGFNKDLYSILGLTCEASSDEIKSAYKKLVRIYHPDVSGVNSDSEKFKEIREAYEILSSEKKRKRYDAIHGYFGERLKKEYDTKKAQNEKYEEILKNAKKNSDKAEAFSNSINEALDNLFGKQKGGKTKSKEKEKREKPVDGEDMETDVTVSVFEAMNGASRKVNILHTEPCPNCEGRKFINGSECNVCNGTGQISKQKKITVRIPAGITQDAKVRVKGEGNKGTNGGKDGDLYLKVNISKSNYYEADGLNVNCNVPITPFEAVLGCEVPVKAGGNTINVKIPPMTSSGQKLRIRGAGLENKTKNEKGDIIVKVVIKLPSRLSDEETELYNKLKDLSKYDIRSEMKNEK